MTIPSAGPGERFYHRLATHAGLDYVLLDPERRDDPDYVEVNLLAARLLSPQVCREFVILPIAYVDETLTVATGDPFDDVAQETAARLTGAKVRLAVSPRAHISRAIERVFAEASSPEPSSPEPSPPPETSYAPAEEDDGAATRPRGGEIPEPRLGELLVARGYLSTSQLAEALDQGEREGTRLGEVLTHERVISEEELLPVLSEQYDLPLVDLADQEPDPEALAIIPERVQRALRCIPLSSDERTLYIALADELDDATVAALREHTQLRLRGFLASPRDIDTLLQRIYGQRYVNVATLALRDERPDDCASRVLTGGQKAFIGAIAVIFLVALFFWPTITIVVATGMTSVYYVLSSLYRFQLTYTSLGHHQEIQIDDADTEALDESTLPIYSLLIPLYREAAVLPALTSGINSLDYPKAKLDVKLLCEEDDDETLDAIEALNLAPHFKVVVVPDMEPKTKPKACNYGLLFADGEYVALFDAEDRPQPDQLKKAVVAFRQSPEELICVQGKLNFFNSEQNLLTRWFTTEYSMWFDLVLPGLHGHEAPIPLGGTSCHFKTEPLIELGAWDPYNVTEDADLGMRLHKQGYRTAMIDSLTLEEANPEIGNWIRQRSRWIKGYMQTYLVHMRSPFRLLREMGFRDFMSFQLVLGSVFILLLNPLFWLLTTVFFFTQAGFIRDVFPGFVFYAAAFQLFIGNFVFVYLNVAGSVQHRYFRLAKFALFVPIYWGLMSLAALKGFWQLIRNPFYWEKTTHGLSATPVTVVAPPPVEARRPTPAPAEPPVEAGVV